MSYPDWLVEFARRHAERHQQFSTSPALHVIYRLRPQDAMYCSANSLSPHDLDHPERCPYTEPGGAWPEYTVATFDEILRTVPTTHSMWSQA